MSVENEVLAGILRELQTMPNVTLENAQQTLAEAGLRIVVMELTKLLPDLDHAPKHRARVLRAISALQGEFDA